MCNKICLKLPYELIDNLNIVYNTTNHFIVFWNKYQIFLINELDFERPETRLSRSKWILVCNTDFIIHHLVLSNNYLICLDNEGQLEYFTRKLLISHHTLLTPTTDFAVLDSNILCMDWNGDYLYSIKYENNECYLRIDYLNPELQFYSKQEIVKESLCIPIELNREKCLLCCFVVKENHVVKVNKIFESRNIDQDGQFSLIIVTFDKLALYALLVDLRKKNGRLSPIKILTCPSEVNSLGIVEKDSLHLIVCLSAGTVINLPLNKDLKSPNLIHLNTAVNKCMLFEHKIVYTDGGTMWILTNIFLESNINLRQLFVKHVKDFGNINNTIICTTYSKQVYMFNLNEESSYLTPVATSEFSTSEHLISNVNYLYRIMEEVEKNDEIINNIKREEDYMTILALSNRQDIMSEIIKYNIKVYESYSNIVDEGLSLNLTNDIEDYFDRNAFYILIKMILNTQNFDMLTNIFTGLQIHITFHSDQKVIKTVTIKKEQLKAFNIVIPLSVGKCNITDVSIDIKIVKKIPKVLDSKYSLWTALHCYRLVLSAEQFIKTDYTSNNIKLLKEPEDSINNLLCRNAYKHHKHLFKINKVTYDSLLWSFYLKLPKMHRELLQNETFYQQQFDSTKAKILLQHLSSEEFLESRRNICLYVRNEKFDVHIIPNEISKHRNDKMLKVSSTNPLLALSIRNFFSNFIHNNFQRHQPGQYNFTCGVMNLEKVVCNVEKDLQNIKERIAKFKNEELEFEEFLIIYDLYQKKLIANIV